jgi:hypothetical protein
MTPTRITNQPPGKGGCLFGFLLHPSERAGLHCTGALEVRHDHTAGVVLEPVSMEPGKEL